MIITLDKYIQSIGTLDPSLGGTRQYSNTLSEPVSGWNARAMLAVQLASGTLFLSGLALTAGLIGSGPVATVFGVAVQLIGIYTMIAATKEESNLKLVDRFLAEMDAEQRDQLVAAIIQNGIGASSGVMPIIEKLLDTTSKNGKYQ